MTTLFTRLVFAAALSLAPSVAIIPAALAGPVEDTVRAAYAAWDDAFNKGDAKAVAAFYTTETLFMPDDAPISRSPAEVETFFAGLFAHKVTGHKLDLIQSVQSGDTLVAAAKWSVQAKDDKGNPTTFSGQAMHVFQKQSDGSWKLKMHTFN